MDERRKRIRLRAWRRGFREIDLILGNFADKSVSSLDAASLADFERLLNQADQDVYEWIVGAAPAPAEFAALIMRIREISVPAARSE